MNGAAVIGWPITGQQRVVIVVEFGDGHVGTRHPGGTAVQTMS